MKSTNKKHKRKKNNMIIRYIFAIALGLLVYWFIQNMKKNGYHYERGKIRSSLIYSLKTSSESNGVFVLGIGSIHGDDYYVFYRKTEAGGLIREKINTNKCVLYEGYTEPKIIESGQVCYGLIDGDTVSTSFSRLDYTDQLHQIYIPKGTITERVNDININ